MPGYFRVLQQPMHNIMKQRVLVGRASLYRDASCFGHRFSGRDICEDLRQSTRNIFVLNPEPSTHPPKLDSKHTYKIDLDPLNLNPKATTKCPRSIENGSRSNNKLQVEECRGACFASGHKPPRQRYQTKLRGLLLKVRGLVSGLGVSMQLKIGRRGSMIRGTFWGSENLES